MFLGEAATSPSLADSSPSLAGGASQSRCCCAEGSAVSKATPRRNKSALKISSTLRLHKGSLKGFLFFKELNSPRFIFLSIRNFQLPLSCCSRRSPGPAGEAAALWPQRTRRCRTLGASACSSTAHQALRRAFRNAD